MSGWIAAGAAFWAARAHTRLGQRDRAAHWLEQAARYPYTLYGVLALNTLGRDVSFKSRRRPFTTAMAELLASTGGGRRALALSEIGQNLRAEQELLALKEWNQPGMKKALRAIADHLRMPAVALRLNRHQMRNSHDDRADEPLDPSLYPVPDWKPAPESGIDQALLFAFMRQESDFSAFAHSPMGAQGLMQIMPATARFLNRGRRFRGARRLDGFDPEINVRLGQRYLSHLRSHRQVRDNLLRVIAAYNSGPGNLSYWTRKRIKHDDDPLLFVEAIPNLQTRLFVRRVLANLWIYRRRLGQSAPSLEAMVAGQFPRYSPIDARDTPTTSLDLSSELVAEFPPQPGG
jgi:soluble lytic murein transglycosylase-like protein